MNKHIPIFKRKIPIYPGWFWVIITDDFDGALAQLKLPVKHDHNNCAGKALGLTESVYLILLKTHSIERPSTIAHECLHICNMLFDDIGIKPDLNNDEPQCYLLSAFIDQVYVAVDEYKKRIKN